MIQSIGRLEVASLTYDSMTKNHVTKVVVTVTETDSDTWGGLLYSVLGKFTNPKIGNHCSDMFGHVVHSVLLH